MRETAYSLVSFRAKLKLTKILLGVTNMLFVVSCAKYTPQPCAYVKEKNDPRILQPGESVTITVCAIEPRNRTGILLQKEGVYRFEVIPSGQTWDDGPNLRKIGADGKTVVLMLPAYLFLRVPFANWFSLCGSIDDRP